MVLASVGATRTARPPADTAAMIILSDECLRGASPADRETSSGSTTSSTAMRQQPAALHRRRSWAERRGQRFPRRSCSRSMASKSALKFPFPKPRDPCRSITSKNTVGRSQWAW